MEIPSVGEVIYNEIRDHILKSVYSPGERLNVDELARGMDTSKTPVREALSHLESEGLVAFRPRVGWRVNALSVEEFTDFLEIQCALRFFISEKLSPYIDGLDFELLSSVNEKLRYLSKGFDYSEIVQQNDIFHMAIFSVYPNKTMLRRLTELDGLIRLNRVRFFEQEKASFPAIAESAFDQHQMILDKLRERDSEAIARALKDHHASILNAYKYITKAVASS